MKRLLGIGTKLLKLPQTSSKSSPHSIIAATEKFEEAVHVVLLMGDSSRALGVIDERIMEGKGGLAKGSVIPLIQGLCASTDLPTAVVLANPGQLYWWPAGRKPITVNASNELRLPSLLHYGRAYHPEVNNIPGHISPEEHMQTVMTDIIARMIPGLKRLSVISQGTGGEVTLKYFDANWDEWSSRLSTIICCGPTMPADCLTSEPFKDFIARVCTFTDLKQKPSNMEIACQRISRFRCRSRYAYCTGPCIDVPWIPDVLWRGASQRFGYIHTGSRFDCGIRQGDGDR